MHNTSIHMYKYVIIQAIESKEFKIIHIFSKKNAKNINNFYTTRIKVATLDTEYNNALEWLFFHTTHFGTFFQAGGRMK